MNVALRVNNKDVMSRNTQTPINTQDTHEHSNCVQVFFLLPASPSEGRGEQSNRAVSSCDINRHCVLPNTLTVQRTHTRARQI